VGFGRVDVVWERGREIIGLGKRARGGEGQRTMLARPRTLALAHPALPRPPTGLLFSHPLPHDTHSHTGRRRPVPVGLAPALVLPVHARALADVRDAGGPGAARGLEHRAVWRVEKKEKPACEKKELECVCGDSVCVCVCVRVCVLVCECVCLCVLCVWRGGARQ
jgi:hypothetical protein